MSKITLEKNGLKGSAEITWIEKNQYSVAHYGVFISVPYQDSRWENLFVYDKKQIRHAEQKAKECLEMALSRCTLC